MANKTRGENISLIGTNIKTPSNRISPTKTTGPMLKEVLLELAGQDPFSGVYGRSNTSSQSSDSDYIKSFIANPSLNNYTDVLSNNYLDGSNGNFFMDLFRAMAVAISESKNNYMDREVKFIANRQITNSSLVGTNWWVADGTNNTDDLRGRQVTGGGPSTDSSGKSFTKPYTGEGGEIDKKLTESNIPEHDHEYLYDDPTGQNSSDGSEDGASTFETRNTSKWGSPNPTPINLSQPETYGTWLQYVSPDTQAPSTPTNVQVVSTSGDSISISWDASTDDTGIQNYKVYVDGSYVGDSSNTSYLISGLFQSTQYSITVKAVDLFGKESGESSPISGTTQDVDTQKPTTPINLAARVIQVPGQGNENRRQVELSWEESTDNEGVRDYTVESKLSTGNQWAIESSDDGSNTSSGIIIHLIPRIFILGSNPTTWNFRVKAFDTSNNPSNNSNVISVNLPATSGSGGGSGGCFIEGVKVTMNNGSTKSIEKIKVGEKVVSKEGVINTVTDIHSLMYDGSIYGFNGGEEFFTESHPFMTLSGKWKSINPRLSMELNPGEEVELLEIGDTVMMLSGPGMKIDSINKSSDFLGYVYNLSVSGDRGFYADNHLVHNDKGNFTLGGNGSGGN